MSPASLSVQQVAKGWGVAVKTVRRMIHRKEIAAVRVGGRIRISPDQVAAYERRHEIGGRA